VRRVVLVGNAPLTRDHSAMVDAADFVVRFNEPRSWGERGGTRFDAWVIANARGGRRFVRQRTFAEAPYRDLPAEIWFPRAAEVHGRLRAMGAGFLREDSERDLSRRILRANGLQGRTVVRFDAAFYWSCLERLQEDGEEGPLLIPSAGFMATNYALARFDSAAVALVGFTFQGWEGHPWRREEAFVRRMERAGTLRLLPS
jgi:hypothetical protein